MTLFWIIVAVVAIGVAVWWFTKKKGPTLPSKPEEPTTPTPPPPPPPETPAM